VASGIGLIVVAPLFAIIAIAIKISSKGPVFYKQERSGLNGRTFMLYKFRTMAADADQKRKELEALNEADGPVFKINNDPRIIPVIGPLLRKTSLDELPQLLNIFRGEMSLVGPRPPIPAEVAQYKPWQRRRLSMKPGLTCIWQTSPNRNDISFNDWMKLDLEYIDNWSPMLDFKLLLKTAQVVLLGNGR
jgi:lipopolysaccharide/colanic/teichoic acid biosynthesis glycosyltransferase